MRIKIKENIIDKTKIIKKILRIIFIFSLLNPFKKEIDIFIKETFLVLLTTILVLFKNGFGLLLIVERFAVFIVEFIVINF